MTIVFYTNFINHHQVPLADEFYKLIGDRYRMVTFEPLPESFRKKGYADYSYKPYLLEAFKSEDNMALAEQLADTADVVILGAAPERFIWKRLQMNKMTFRYGERLFKKIDRRYIKYSFWKTLYKQHTIYRNKPLYMLAASAYMKSDVSLLCAYPGKVFRWGYFVNAPDMDIREVLHRKRNQPVIRILWCGTYTQFKRPDLMIKLAGIFKKNHVNVSIEMLGDEGGWGDMMREMIREDGVEDYVSLIGTVPNETVLEMMRSHHIFAFTSDRGEGWGVVLNEAMCNGCSVVASDKIGAAPFLVKNGENGLLFKSGDVNSLYRQIMKLVVSEETREAYAINAYETLQFIWSPRRAARNFLTLVDDLQNGRKSSISEGPCSVAEYVNTKKLRK